MPAILAALLPLLLPQIPSIVKAVEKLFGAKTGPTKLDTAVLMVKALADQLQKNGVIPGNVDVATIASIIQSVVSELIARGELPSSTTPPSLPGAPKPAFVVYPT